MDLTRKEGETESQYLWRVGNMKESDDSITWDDIADYTNAYFRSDESEYRTSSAYRKPFEYAKKFYEEVFSKLGNRTMSSEIEEIKKERYKLQTEKIEYNKNLREQARDELIFEHISSAVATLSKFDTHEYRPIKEDEYDRSYLLTITDAHFGIEFEIPDLAGNIINSYSPEIFKSRMNTLFNRVIETIDKEHIKLLHIWELGDSIQGILRLNSQLMQLRYGVIESALLYAEYMASWLDDLSSYVNIEYQMVHDSNHSQLRLCGAPKNAFPDENMGIVINSFLKERLKDNPNITIVDNPTGMNYAVLSGYKVLGVHGEVKDMEVAINEYAKMYNSPIDYLIGGHSHHAHLGEVGINSEVIGVRSIIGIDPYGASLRKTSDPGANLFVFEDGNGKVIDYNYKLNA